MEEKQEGNIKLVRALDKTMTYTYYNMRRKLGTRSLDERGNKIRKAKGNTKAETKKTRTRVHGYTRVYKTVQKIFKQTKNDARRSLPKLLPIGKGNKPKIR